MKNFYALVCQDDCIDGEAYTKSNYLFHEQATMDFFISCLMNLGYKSQDHSGRVWSNTLTEVVVCLTDDAYTFGTDSALPLSPKVHNKTIVITDNSFLGIPKHSILKVPNSYFGIYSYTPEHQDWNPTRRFNFSVNRFCKQRLLILLELIHQTGSLETVLEQDYVNFNVFNPVKESNTVTEMQSFFSTIWNTVDITNQGQYQQYVETLLNEIPINNHNFTHNQVHVNAWMNVVVETYAGDVNRTVSEKTFRALVTPVPWTLYACRYTVEMLKEMEFDVLDDIVDHSYNKVLQISSQDGIEKIRQFIAASIDTQRKLAEMDFDKLKARCIKAAEHNQKLLAEMRKQWPVDFLAWLPGALKQL